jgi:uncharacterized phage protein gp47/JayE
VQYIVDGLDSDASSYPGYKAAGVQVEVSAPTVRHVTFIIDVTLIAGVSINAVVDDIKSKVSAYVNGLGVGQDVILSEIISAIMAVDSVADVEIITPSANIAIADNELARVSDTEIVIG